MKNEDMVGKTLLGISRVESFRLKGWRVYLEPSVEHPAGRKVAEEYDLKRIIKDHPELRRARVSSAEDYYGITILRMKRGA